MLLAALFFGAFGLIVGSFLNVLIIRHGVRSLGGRSGCMKCGTRLAWHDMIPVLSWIALFGKCRNCLARISIQYPLVELSTGFLFALIGTSVGATLPLSTREIVHLVLALPSLPIAALLIAIFVYDLKHTIIPDAWVYTFAGFALLSQFLMSSSGEYGSWLFLAGPVVALPIFVLWAASVFRHGTPGMWMGFGDVKLALGIGWLLGPALGFVAVFGAFVVGALVSVCVLLPLPYIAHALYTLGITSQKMPRGGFTMRSEIPFGPFLIFSCIILWLCTLYGIHPVEYLGLFSLVEASL